MHPIRGTPALAIVAVLAVAESSPGAAEAEAPPAPAPRLVQLSGRVCVGHEKAIWVWTGDAAGRKDPGCQRPIAGAEVTLSSADGSRSRTRTAADGTFSLDPIAIQGRVDDRLEVFAAGYPGVHSRGVGAPGGFLGDAKNEIIVLLPGVVDPWWREPAPKGE